MGYSLTKIYERDFKRLQKSVLVALIENAYGQTEIRKDSNGVLFWVSIDDDEWSLHDYDEPKTLDQILEGTDPRLITLFNQV